MKKISMGVKKLKMSDENWEKPTNLTRRFGNFPCVQGSVVPTQVDTNKCTQQIATGRT